MDRRDVETLVSPYLHSVHCLVDVPPCYNSRFNLLMDPQEEGENYQVGYYLSDNQPLIDFAQSVRSNIPVGLRVLAMGTVEESVMEEGKLKHIMTLDEVAVADEGMGCPTDMESTENTVAPSMLTTETGTMNATMTGTEM